MKLFKHAWIASSLLGAIALAAPQGESWRFYRVGNTGIQGDYNDALFVGADGDPWIAGYDPFAEEGGFAKLVQAENRWLNFSNVEHPVIGDPALVGSARVFDFAPDANGALWMGTWRGLLYFDAAHGGSSLQLWNAQNSLHPGGRTMDVDVAPDGSVWAAVLSVSWGGGGVVRYVPSTGVMTHWGSIAKPDGWPSNTSSTESLSIQPKLGGGYTVWITSLATGKILWFDSTTQHFQNQPIQFTPGELRELPGTDCVDDAGNVWFVRVGPAGNTFTLEYKTQAGTWVAPPLPFPGAANDIWAFKAFGNAKALLVDANSATWRFDGTSWTNLGIWRQGAFTYGVDQDAAGNVWVSGTGGAAKRDQATGTWQRYRVTNTAMFDNFTRDLALDDDGRVWITANAGSGVGGMTVFDSQRWFGFNNSTYGLGGPWNFPTDNSDAICARAANDHAVVNPMFNGIHEWDGTSFTNLNGMGESEGLVEDSLGRIWSVGTYFSLRYFDAGVWQPVAIAGWGLNVQRDPSAPGMVWAAANLEVVRTDGVYRFGRQNTQFAELNPQSDTLSSVVALPGASAWVGSSKGLFRLDSTTGTYQYFGAATSPLLAGPVSPLAASPDGRVWFANFGSGSTPNPGLCWFDGVNAGVYTVEPGGLPHAQIVDIEVRAVPHGYELWVCCMSRGIAVLTIHEQAPGTILCSGDGSGSTCPCGNPSSSGSSSGCANSTGGGATLRASGTAALSNDDLLLTSAGLPTNKSGLVFMGVAGKVGTPFADGLLCIQAPLKRLAVNSSGTAGTFAHGPGLAGYAQLHFAQTFWFDAGETWHFQTWYRDPSGPCGGGSNTSNALAVTFVP